MSLMYKHFRIDSHNPFAKLQRAAMFSLLQDIPLV